MLRWGLAGSPAWNKGVRTRAVGAIALEVARVDVQWLVHAVPVLVPVPDDAETDADAWRGWLRMLDNADD